MSLPSRHLGAAAVISALALLAACHQPTTTASSSNSAAPTSAVSAAVAAASAASSTAVTSGSAPASDPGDAQFTGDLAFASYPATVYHGPAATPDFEGADKAYADYRTALGDAASQGPKFGGAYAVAEIGCGTGCRNAYLVDLRTGHVYDGPDLGGDANPNLQFLYKPDSNLFEAEWTSDDSSACIRAFLLWDGQTFKTLQQRQAPGNCPDLE